MTKKVAWCMCALLLVACGGSSRASEPPEEEVTAEWTAGDDAAEASAEGSP